MSELMKGQLFKIIVWVEVGRGCSDQFHPFGGPCYKSIGSYRMGVKYYRNLCRFVIQVSGIGLIIIFQDIGKPLRFLLEILGVDKPEILDPDLPPFQVSRIFSLVVELAMASQKKEE